MVSATFPLLLMTSRHPACAVAAVPSVVGRLPTSTQPPGRMPRAVVRPTPPGHGPGSEEASICANTVCWPPGEICTIVVPVPCRLFELLKLLTRTSPLTRLQLQQLKQPAGHRDHDRADLTRRPADGIRADRCLLAARPVPGRSGPHDGPRHPAGRLGR